MADKTGVIDISHWKYPVDFAAVKAAGFEFCIAKATEGETWTDPNFFQYLLGMDAACIVPGSYHYFRVLSDPVIQAKHYYMTASNKPPYFPPIVDVERINNTNSATRLPLVSTATFTAKLKTFLDQTTLLWGQRPWIYTNAYSWHTLTTKPVWAKDYPLWVANYGVTAPYLPVNWVAWQLWQYTAAYPIAGKNFDANWFPGTKEELLVLCGGVAPITDAEKLERLWQAHPELH